MVTTHSAESSPLPTLGKTTTYSYDALDRVTSVTLPPVSTTPGTFTRTYSYDTFDGASGLLTRRLTDANGVVSSRGYDAYGELVKVRRRLAAFDVYGYLRGLVSSVTDANGYLTRYSYDAADRMTTVTYRRQLCRDVRLHGGLGG